MKVYIHISPPGKREYGPYWHNLVCLAEGFKSIGIEVYGTYNYYYDLNTASYLIVENKDIHFSDCDVLLLSYKENDNDQEYTNIIKQIKNKNRKYFVAFTDSSDGVRTPGFQACYRSCDAVLKAHFNEKYKYPSNFIPWQFGMSNRIIEAIQPIEYRNRKQDILINFRAKHQLRDMITQMITPALEQYLTLNHEMDGFSADGFSEQDLLHWRQSDRRHNPQYYQRLSESMACACYGGVFAIPIGNYNKYTAKIARILNNIVHLYPYDRVRQFDSWRIWEAWVAGSLVMHIDFEKYGCKYPVNPINGVHYIGINPENLSKFEEELSKGIDHWEAIAQAGQKWALENYSPKAIAERFLQLLH